MRTLYLGSGPELVEGLVTDRLKNDMNPVKDIIELAITGDDVEDAPITGWALREEVRMIGDYTVLPSVSHTASARGKFKLWGRWTNPPETVVLLIGRFRVI
jgi:hypothetical protein